MILNTADVRTQNRRRVAEYLLNNPEKTQLDIQMAMGMSDRTVLELLKELNRSGVVEQKQLPKHGVGRPPVAWSIRADARYSIGVRPVSDALQIAALDLRGNLAALETIDLGLVDALPPELRQEVLYGGYRAQRRAGDYQEQVNDAIIREVGAFITRHEIALPKLLGIGIAVGGSISDGIWTFGEWQMDIMEESERMHAALGAPVAFFREEQQSGVAEAWQAGLGSAVCILLDKTVGGMAMQSYQLWDGDLGHGVSIGHMVLYPGGKPCACGKRGCFNAYCSEQTLLEAGYASADAFFAALGQGSVSAAAVWETFLQDLAKAICSLTALFDVPILLSGMMVRYLAPYMPRLEAILAEQSGTDFPIRLHLGHYRENAAVIGTALQWHRRFMREGI